MIVESFWVDKGGGAFEPETVMCDCGIWRGVDCGGDGGRRGKGSGHIAWVEEVLKDVEGYKCSVG